MFQFVSVGSREFAVIVRMQRFHDILFEFLFSSVGNIKYLSGFLLYNCFLSFFKSSYITILKSYAVVKTGKCIWLFFSGHISKDSLWFAECVEPAIGHFRVHVCLLFKASLSAKFFL